jgi:hypothetical protein
MSDYMTLMGSEEVSRAGYVMRDAASSMNSAVGNLSEVLDRQQRFMDDWLQRFEMAVAAFQSGGQVDGWL